MLKALLALVALSTLAVAFAQPLLTFAAREGTPPERIAVTLVNPGIPAPGSKMEVIWRTTPQRMYGLTNGATFPIHWTGYVYSGFHLFTSPTATVPLTPETHIGGYSQWQRTLAAGETYWGPSSGPFVEGGERTVHVWHFNVAPHLWQGDTITLWLEPVVYGGITSGGHAHGLHHAVDQDVSLLKLRVVAD